MGAMSRTKLLAAVALLLVPSLGWGAGFALFEHGNRAMAMGGAFTAVADDPSAIYWNPAGLAFQQDKGIQVMTGATFIMPSQDFYGESPYPGDGYAATQNDQVFFPPHFYMVYPINDRLTFGFGVLTPFGLGTWWEDDFAGRYISKRVDLKLFDFTPNLAIKVSDNVAVSVGVDYAIGQIDLTKTLGLVNPYTQRLTDVGQVHLYTDGTGNDAFGWNAGMLLKFEHGFSAGMVYRSKIKIDYSGEGSFTQYPTGYADYDAVIASQIPFGTPTPITTSIDFPDFFSLGFAWANEDWTVSVQTGWMGWQSFQELPINFTEHPELSTAVEEYYRNVSQGRLGVEYRMDESWAFRGGYLYDQTPQPADSMSPLLGDGDRQGLSLGFGYKHDNWWVDVGDLYLWIKSRSTHGRSLDGYEGRYDGTANLFGVTFGMSF